MTTGSVVSQQPAPENVSQAVSGEVKPKRVMIVAGEASGDAYGGALVQSVHRRDPSVSFFGIGERAKRKRKRQTHRERET